MVQNNKDVSAFCLSLGVCLLKQLCWQQRPKQEVSHMAAVEINITQWELPGDPVV